MPNTSLNIKLITQLDYYRSSFHKRQDLSFNSKKKTQCMSFAIENKKILEIYESTWNKITS